MSATRFIIWTLSEPEKLPHVETYFNNVFIGTEGGITPILSAKMEDIVSHRQIDCVPGNLCVGNYPGYTKCLADTDTSTYWESQSNTDAALRIVHL